MSLVASAFFYQFFVHRVWGPIPIYLQELAPPAPRTTAVWLTYQLGNLASRASAKIQANMAGDDGERARMEYAESADELEMLRKQGVSLSEIGEEIQEEKEKRGDVDVEHLEKTVSA